MIGIYSEFYFYSSVVPSLLSAATGLMVLFSLLSSKVKLKNYTYYQAQLLIGASDLIRMTVGVCVFSQCSHSCVCV